MQSVLCGADALQPTKTGAVGSAKLALHENGTLEYQVSGGHPFSLWRVSGVCVPPWHCPSAPRPQVQVVGTASEVVGVTLETKPRRKSKRNVLFDMTASYKDGLVSAAGCWEGWHGDFG